MCCIPYVDVVTLPRASKYPNYCSFISYHLIYITGNPLPSVSLMADLAPTPDYPETSNDRVQDSINHVLERALTETLLHGKPSITLKQRPKGAGFFINPTTAALEMSEPDADTYKTYSFPGKDAHEAWRFSM